MYQDGIDEVRIGEWCQQAPASATACGTYNKTQTQAARQAFYALCTHIDHQLRLVIGTLRQEKLLDDTTILFTSDHGDMLGNHGLWGKRRMYEDSNQIPFIVSLADHHPAAQAFNTGEQDTRLLGLQDLIPSLLDISNITIPDSCEGKSFLNTNEKSERAVKKAMSKAIQALTKYATFCMENVVKVITPAA